MNDRTDSQLLRAYAEQRSEAAFAELVRRHVDFVHSAARRMVRDAHLAEDVTQGVFVALAKNPGPLNDHPVLSGWLHRTAQNIAAQTVRTDVRRRAREQEAAAMNELLAPAPDAPWEDIAPHLDAALGELTEADRDALLLRYFERKSAQEMASVLGISDEAAQKRVSRAVERLREFLARRGVTAGESGLVVLISANAVLTAPAGLSAAIAATALAGTTLITAATATVGKAIAMTTMQKTLIAAALVAASVGTSFVVRHQANETLRAENAALRAQTSQLAELEELRAENQRLAKLQTDADELARLRKDQGELLRLRGEVTRLRGLEAELAKLREESLRQQEQSRAASAATEVAFQKFEAQRAVTINAMKRVGLQLRVLEKENNLNSAFTADGNLNPALLAGNQFDLRKVEMLVSDPSQLGKLLDESPASIVARTLEPIPTPDGRWLRFYTLADGSVQNFTTEHPNQAFTGNWQLQIVKPRP